MQVELPTPPGQGDVWNYLWQLQQALQVAFHFIETELAQKKEENTLGKQ